MRIDGLAISQQWNSTPARAPQREEEALQALTTGQALPTTATPTRYEQGRHPADEGRPAARPTEPPTGALDAFDAFLRAEEYRPKGLEARAEAAVEGPKFGFDLIGDGQKRVYRFYEPAGTEVRKPEPATHGPKRPAAAYRAGETPRVAPPRLDVVV